MQRRTLSRRTFLKAAAVSAAGAALAACAPPAAPSTAPQAEGGLSPAAEVIEIVHVDRNIPQDVEFRTELAERFQEMNPNISVKVEVMPDDFAQTLITRLASNTAGDCFRSATHWGIVNWVLRGVLQPLDDYIAQDSFDTSVYFGGAMDSCRIEGKTYALPVNGHPGWSALYYQPELFAEAGVAEPTDEWTYDNMLDAALGLTKRNGDQIDVYVTTACGARPRTTCSWPDH